VKGECFRPIDLFNSSLISRDRLSVRGKQFELKFDQTFKRRSVSSGRQQRFSVLADLLASSLLGHQKLLARRLVECVSKAVGNATACSVLI
jgi:hypothetical protein